MFTPTEKDASFAAFHAAVNAGMPQDPEEARRAVSTMLRLQAHYIRLQARAMEHAARALGVEVDPERWAALVCEDMSEKLGPVLAKLNEHDGFEDDPEVLEFADYIDPPYHPATEHRFAASDYGVSERRAVA